MEEVMNKKLATLFASLWVAVSAPAIAEEVQQPNIAVVNFKECLEKSKWGQQEQEKFNKLRDQIQAAIEKKEVALKECSTKLADSEYVDSLSPEAEEELKNQQRQIAQEIGQMQQQTFQMLNQANYQILQAMQHQVNEAANKLAQSGKYSLILNQETCFFYSKGHDVTAEVVAEMDRLYEEANKQSGQPQTSGKTE
jgi:outer membrane protein